MSIQTAVSGVVSKPGYSSMAVNGIGQTITRQLFEKELMLWWEGEFPDYSSWGGPNATVEPTTQELQRLYDAATGANGDPVMVNATNFSILVLDLVLETATDVRWTPYINLAKFIAADSGHPYDVGLANSLVTAASGITVSNYIRDQQIEHPKPELFPNGATVAPELPNNSGVPAATDTTKALVELYIGYFNRAPEFGGLKTWEGEIHNKISSGLSFDDALAHVSNQFWPAASVTYSHLTGYSETMTTNAFVTKVYANVLGRPDAALTDQAGINHWVNALDSGAIKSRGDFMVAIEKGAHDYIKANPNDPVSIHVDAYLANRTDVGLFFAQEQHSGKFFGDAAVVAGTAALANVTDRAASVTESINSIKSGEYMAVANSTIELTGATDIHTPDVFVI